MTSRSPLWAARKDRRRCQRRMISDAMPAVDALVPEIPAAAAFDKSSLQRRLIGGAFDQCPEALQGVEAIFRRDGRELPRGRYWN